MRLLFVLSSLHRGGAERHTIDLAAALVRRGHVCELLSIKDAVPGGLQVVPEAEVPLSYAHSRRFLDMAAVRSLAARIDAFAPDLIVAASSYALLHAWLARRVYARRRPRVAVVNHTTRLRTLKDHVLGFLYRRVYARADLLIFVCEDQRRYWRSRGMGARRVEVIHNGIDAALFAPDSQGARAAMRSSLGIADDTLVLGITAAFRPEKNHLFLVRALHALRGLGLAVQLLMVGDGPLRQAAVACAEQLGVAEHCRFVGAHDDVRPYVSAFDVFVLASTHIETFPLSALEAMGMGVPAVLSDVGGVREMVQAGVNGYLYAAGDEAGFVAAIQRLMEPAQRRALGHAARAIVTERFTHERMVMRYEQLLGEVVSPPRA